MCNELSILIPVYNYDIRQLVGNLHQQCLGLGIAFEILCADDGSSPDIISGNTAILSLSHTCYDILPQHLGRVAIRNKLASDARYSCLLLLDNDSQVIHPRFIGNYLDAAGSAPVLMGGTCYQQERPPAPYLLRWRYGRKREERTAAQRNMVPYQAFHINNIFLARDIFLRFPLQPLIRGYGHEDSLFGHHLQAAGIPVRHLDNPVLHAGLEPAGVFLEKSRQAIENLYWLYARDGIGAGTRLVRGFLVLRKWKLLPTFQAIYQAFAPGILRNLKGPAPSLWLFDLFKLYHFTRQAGKVVLRNTF
jgi:glycosyltransferase involved in cell wall biosynthesis